MPTYDTIKRQGKPRLEVLRGYNPNEPFQQSATHPVKDGEDIKSGQTITLEADSDSPTGSVWIICPTGFTDGAVYVALQDATDEDVVSAGNLPGLSCAGQYEFESAFFDGADNSAYTEGLYIKPSTANAGNVMLTAAANPVATETVIGQITRKPGNTSGYNSNVDATDVITWRTVFIPRTATA